MSVNIDMNKLIRSLGSKVSEEELRASVKEASDTGINIDDMCAIEKFQYANQNFEMGKIASENPEVKEKYLKLASEAAKELDIAKIADVTSDLVLHKLAMVQVQALNSQAQENNKQAQDVMNSLLG